MIILYGGRAQVAGRLEEVLSARDRLQMTCEMLEPETVAAVEELVERAGRANGYK